MPKKATKTPKRPAAGKRYPLNMRTTGALRQALELAATTSGRSIAQEVEHRLERSFQSEAVFTEALGGPDLRNLSLILISAFASADAYSEGRSPKEWLRDPNVYRIAVGRTLRALVDQMPDSSDSEKKQLALDVLNAAGLLKYDFNDGRGPVASGFIEPVLSSDQSRREE